MGSADLTYVDLFAGAGGLSTGLERAGFELIHAIDIDQDASATFANNREGWSPEEIIGDIREVDKSEIHDTVGRNSVDLVAGGPPCQGFSEVVSPDGSDERNHLFVNFIDWVDELEPQAALFENVRGIQNTAEGKFLDAVNDSFANIGYNVTHRVVTSSDFGVPQHRRRVVLLATKDSLKHQPLGGFELNPVKTPGVIDGIGDLPEVGPGEEITEYDQSPQTVLQNDLRGDSDELTAHQAARHDADMVEMISHIPDGGNRTAIPDELQPSSGYHNSYSRLKSDEPAVAITRNMSKPSSARCIHPFQHRGLTPREGARLQTFPDSYRFEGGLVSTRKQIGNAVPPYLAEALGYYLKQAVYHEDLTDANRERIQILRSGSLSLEQFKEKRSEIGGIEQQATLDSMKF
ncbi:DNA cytosine methyltransferase [Haloferax virus Halfgib1]|uniref:DNA (cytosine-5-)-methyltransferase n=1 Tax=Haloferax gibbonsii (strain ATCC 33959 / DSM 4427 / JCM 8863 / NBRC 102184 / NCIMB 2188 / Ma 2.38) TaxID=1227459 RepID=M0H2C0_HALGM|nr:DNA cytosine methyltransferase [Haloferax gibbonsii]ELZ77928.1 DNA-cytosine methyltransferase [Haloferax gibbonsii ATCC 33959]QRG24192.1 DNA cytosine methyltransferase [Haloferax virus Halfgib1]